MFKPLRLATMLALLLAGAAHAADAPVPVTLDNFVRAESDRYFALTAQRGGFGQFAHWRELMPVDAKTVVRPNRDTLYSTAVFDLDAGPVTVVLPEAGKRYRSLAVIDEDHHVLAMHYRAGSYRIAREDVGTRYVLLGVRTLIDPASSEDLQHAHALQDRIIVSQPGGPGQFAVPAWDKASQDRLRAALIVLGTTLRDSRGMFGAPGKVDPLRHLVGSAIAWGGNPEHDAFYQIVTPQRNDGATAYRLDVPAVPVGAFWSISVYDAQGRFQRNELGAYTLNNLTARKGEGGKVSVRFGDCKAGAANCLPIMPGWNYMIRYYLPQPAILDGGWKMPEPQPLS
ncbi:MULTISPECIES: DUF1254 domain-containing protein [Pseudomonas aeruginosa group]|uniref:DUF1254 domain-containing protein n=1 Tax=Pseudomonas aeruginosa group TaxID=136841 RepID=UPI000AC43795|nr:MULTISPECIES: DUF1254 domain-containing protein [Pseudomonas aeruginosa group]VTS14830.1 Protein of uncharacterised function (DUF1254) [Streptococcus dysgalactiae subsp. equisimilis]MBG7007758.1 DUF1254 domain-containing protein [Pseudomonas aeruginosa]MBG7027181.1 DUF1254 domain-containing protein [Pseudomonas aeruginosa]MBG7372719.1 DUF1254 domain-containing protein [Pseudomonas aeruginosa]MCW8021407.1 DUF1254 domain-containing protein [Pseudomonas aeruginosa]